MKTHISVLIFTAFLLSANAQKKNDSYRLHIRKTNYPVTIDGMGDEQAWKETDVAKDFFMVLPMDKGKANELS